VRIGWNIGYWAGHSAPTDVAESLRGLEQAGLDSFWTSEAYGSDSLTPLAWWGSVTGRVRLGTAVTQISARTPTATAMAALTLDQLSGGRFVLGVGVSGPQVVEGWYGQPFEAPLSRTREFVSVLRQVWAREGPVRHRGRHYELPLEGGTGLGKPLKSALYPLRRDIPIMLAAEGPRNIALAGEIAAGWLAFLFSPRYEQQYREYLEEGLARREPERSSGDFEIVATVPVSFGETPEEASRPIREMLALYIGGMGARRANFHFDAVSRMGYTTVAKDIQRRYLDGKPAEAAAAVPLELVDALALVGDEDRVRRQLAEWSASSVTTLLIQGSPETARRIIALAQPTRRDFGEQDEPTVS
jgi:F420-dependent oxidoreductase-like protein